MNIFSSALIFLTLIACALQCHGFSYTQGTNILARSKSQSCRLGSLDASPAAVTTSSRRESIQRLVSIFGITSAVLNLPHEAIASDKEPVIWKSGKAPIVPGQKPKDKNDVSGTRKDPNFLRSIATCKSQCEQSNGPDGFARSREECLSDCQDICCTTYEQCTFAIVPR
jgi:hypothetical protein